MELSRKKKNFFFQISLLLTFSILGGFFNNPLPHYAFPDGYLVKVSYADGGGGDSGGSCAVGGPACSRGDYSPSCDGFSVPGPRGEPGGSSGNDGWGWGWSPPPSCTASCADWSSCSASCGGGTQSRTCTREDCSTYTETQSCNTQPCAPSVSLSANPPTINRGQSSTLSWNSSNADWCDITNDVGPDIGRVEVNGSRVVTLTETTNYTITCVGSGGTANANANAAVTVRPLPTVDLQGPNIVELPRASNIASFNLNWVNANADSCSASLDWSGNKTPPNQGTESLSKARGSYSFKLSCTGPGCPGTGLCPVFDTQNTRVVEVPQCVFTADPATIPVLPATSTLSWDCTHTIGGGGNPCTIDQGIGSVAAVGSLTVRPSQTTTYTLICEGHDGSKSFTTSVGIGFVPKLKEVIPRP